MMRRITALFLLLPALAATTTFAFGSKIATTYRDPEVKTAAFTKIFVAVLSPDADLRRRAEGGLARRIKNSVSATTLVPGDELRDTAALKARLASDGFDGAIVVRPVGVDTEATVSDSRLYATGYPSLTNYWETNWRTVYLPGYVNIEKVVTVEVAVYSVANEKVIWVGRMTSADAKSLREFLDELVKVGAGELKKQKLI
jgi:hypothetical protein